jgi:hypothetical protein
MKKAMAVPLLMLFVMSSVAEARPKNGWLRALDWKYLGVESAKFLLANLDAHTGARCISRFPTCAESGLFGKRPSSVALYTRVNIFAGGTAIADLWAKKSGRENKGTEQLWLFTASLPLTANIVGTTLNVQRYNNLCRKSNLVC